MRGGPSIPSVPGSAVRLPPEVRAPFEVYVNGVRQAEGTDFEHRDGLLLFGRELAQEGRLGAGRWILGAIGIGTYRANHDVDVRYTRADGQATVARGLPVEARP